MSTTTIQKILNSNLVEFSYQSNNRPKKILTPELEKIIHDWLTEDSKKPRKRRRTAKRIYQILRDKYDYKGSYESISRVVKGLKEELNLKHPEVFIPLSFEPGEAFQFDWGEVRAYIGNELLKLYVAVVVLCHSRHFYARAYISQKQEFMLDAHQNAFKFFGGICKRGIYDNMKTAVKSILKGRHRNVQERFAKFCSYNVYEPDFCSPAKGNEKGIVEKKVGFVNRNFFVPEIHVNNMEELNAKLEVFCIEQSKITKHPEYTEQNCYEIYLKEKEHLAEIKEYEFECCGAEHKAASALSRVHFEWNWYSVPEEYASKQLLIKGYVAEVVISCNGKEIARHTREFGRNKFIYIPQHYLGTLERKPGAIRNGIPFKDWKLPEVFEDYRKLLKRHYKDADKHYVKTLVLLKTWSLDEVTEAIKISISSGVVGDSYIYYHF